MASASFIHELIRKVSSSFSPTCFVFVTRNSFFEWDADHVVCQNLWNVSSWRHFFQKKTPLTHPVTSQFYNWSQQFTFFFIQAKLYLTLSGIKSCVHVGDIFSCISSISVPLLALVFNGLVRFEYFDNTFMNKWPNSLSQNGFTG